MKGYVPLQRIIYLVKTNVKLNETIKYGLGEVVICYNELMRGQYSGKNQPKKTEQISKTEF